MGVEGRRENICSRYEKVLGIQELVTTRLQWSRNWSLQKPSTARAELLHLVQGSQASWPVGGGAYTWNGGSKMENRMCRSGSRPGEQKGVVGTLAIYIKQNSLFILSPVSLLKVLQLLWLEPHKLQVNLEDAHWYSWVNAYGSICAGELQWSWNVYFKSLKSLKFTSSLASMLSSCSFLGSHNFHIACFGSSSLLNS